MNNIKTFLLMGILTAILVFFGTRFGGTAGGIMALSFALFINVFSYWNSDKIVLKMYKAQEIEPSDPIYNIVRDLVQKAELPMPKVYMINQGQPNAFATGRNPEHSAVAVTRGLTEILSPTELRGVIAHELGHIHNRDILIGTIAATLAGAISFLGEMARWTAIFGGRDDEENGGIGELLAAMILAPLAAFLIQMTISRTREYKADRFGGKLCGNPHYLANALRKLEANAKGIPMDAKPATAHMFIINPLVGDNFRQLFSTHPSTENRIKKLLELE